MNYLFTWRDTRARSAALWFADAGDPCGTIVNINHSRLYVFSNEHARGLSTRTCLHVSEIAYTHDGRESRHGVICDIVFVFRRTDWVFRRPKNAETARSPACFLWEPPVAYRGDRRRNDGCKSVKKSSSRYPRLRRNATVGYCRFCFSEITACIRPRSFQTCINDRFRIVSDIIADVLFADRGGLSKTPLDFRKCTETWTEIAVRRINRPRVFRQYFMRYKNRCAFRAVAFIVVWNDEKRVTTSNQNQIKIQSPIVKIFNNTLLKT